MSSLHNTCCISRAYYGSVNFFGGPSTTSVKASAKLKQLEEENEDAMFVIVSDVWLDSVDVMEKLNLMFSGLVLVKFHFTLVPVICDLLLFFVCVFVLTNVSNI